VNTTRSDAIYFGAPGGELFGWLHQPSARADRSQPHAAMGLVICNSFGREELCAHRTLRHLAEGAATAGVPTLRFDYHGTGDSAGDLLDPQRTQAWIESVGHAIDALKRHAGVEQVCLLGFRLGTLLAAQAAQGRSDVAAFVALAPVVSGRAFVRELRVFGMKTAAPSGDVAPDPNALLESGGYAMSRETQDDLSRLTLQRLPAPPARRVLVVDRDDRPDAAHPWVDQLRQAGVDVTAHRMTGYAEMMAPPHHSVVPPGLIDDVAAWLSQLGRAVTTPHAAAPPLPEPKRSVVWPSDAANGHAVRESSCVVDPATGLNGILSLPADADADTPPQNAVILLPPGADRHLGPGRVYVGLARQLAARGLAVLRLDISGVGDSPARVGCRENVVYGPQAVPDIAAAVSHLRNTLGIRHCELVGHCSGAYNAFKAAVAEVPVESVVLINPLVFFWKPGMSLDNEMSETRVAYAAMNYRRNVFSLAHWSGLLREPRKIGYAARVVLRRPLSILTHASRDLLRRGGVVFADDLGRELVHLFQRDIAMRFVFATGDPGEALLRSLGGGAVRDLLRQGALTMSHVEGADHDFTHHRQREWLRDLLTKMLVEHIVPRVVGRRVAPTVAGGPRSLNESVPGDSRPFQHTR
jgi:alpha-beta hydrolase superfamily lysophospholipase